ncbi:MAG TPA: LamG-like jellyroll fold domain-containing protein [Verrucomicrobiae bacterium]
MNNRRTPLGALAWLLPVGDGSPVCSRPIPHGTRWRPFLWLTIGLIALLFRAAAAGDFVVQPVGATSSGSHSVVTLEVFAWNGAGLLGGGTDWVTSGKPVPTAWPAHANGNGNEHWHAPLYPPNPAWIRFDLGHNYLLQGMRLWNHNQATDPGRGVRSATIGLSLDGTNFAPVTVQGLNADGYFHCAPGAESYTGELYSFTGLARHVQFTITNNWNGGLAYVGMSEVRFIAALSVPVTSGLVSWWRAEGNATDSTGVNHGNFVGGATTSLGQVGSAFVFDGQTSYVQVPDDPTLDPRTNSFTLTAWIQTTNLSGTIVSKYDCGGACPSCVSASLYNLSLSEGQPVAYLRNQNPECLDAVPLTARGVVVADGLFHQLAMMRDVADHQLRLYVDGQLVASTNLDITTDGDITNGDGEPDPLLIGAVIRGGSQVRQGFFQGLIDEVRLFNRSLSQGEVENLHVAEGGRPHLRGVLSNSTLTLSWPAAVLNPVLESCSVLNDGLWETVTNTVIVLEGDRATVALPAGHTPHFFRLRIGDGFLIHKQQQQITKQIIP